MRVSPRDRPSTAGIPVAHISSPQLNSSEYSNAVLVKSSPTSSPVSRASHRDPPLNSSPLNTASSHIDKDAISSRASSPFESAYLSSSDVDEDFDADADENFDADVDNCGDDFEDRRTESDQGGYHVHRRSDQVSDQFEISDSVSHPVQRSNSAGHSVQRSDSAGHFDRDHGSYTGSDKVDISDRDKDPGNKRDEGGHRHSTRPTYTRNDNNTIDRNIDPTARDSNDCERDAINSGGEGHRLDTVDPAMFEAAVEAFDR